MRICDIMASDEHKKLAQFIKEVHSMLRNLSSRKGAIEAWNEHCEQKATLEQYARVMEKLATEHWDVNSCKQDSPAISRIKWAADKCHEYFVNKAYLVYKAKEALIANKIDIELEDESFSKPIKLIDVGSCYNPFQSYSFMDVFAVDLCPANNSVLQCDFLNVTIETETKVINSKVTALKESSFEVVTFCFLLEYIPSPELRILACENAYSILKPGGLLIISTPDSKHVGANYRIMKCWRFTLALIGFTRIKYEKLPHMHCMVFRKAMHKPTAVRWATLHKEPYMECTLKIPQDFQKKSVTINNHHHDTDVTPEVLIEMPFCGIDNLESI